MTERDISVVFASFYLVYGLSLSLKSTREMKARLLTLAPTLTLILTLTLAVELKTEENVDDTVAIPSLQFIKADIQKVCYVTSQVSFLFISSTQAG